MVSGLVTSPCDQLRIFSGEARLIRMESKSVIAVPRSNGLERYKVCPPAVVTPPRAAPVLRVISFCLNSRAEAAWSWDQACAGPRHRLISGRGELLASALNTLNQLHVQAERLQFADQHVE